MAAQGPGLRHTHTSNRLRGQPSRLAMVHEPVSFLQTNRAMGHMTSWALLVFSLCSAAPRVHLFLETVLDQVLV